jgi:hypothetical protein
MHKLTCNYIAFIRLSVRMFQFRYYLTDMSLNVEYDRCYT